MSAEPFIGEIIMFGGTFAPRDWAFCDGQLLPISENQALFSLLGTHYGGDGRSTFGLPDLRGRVPLHVGGSSGPGLQRYREGQRGGREEVILTKSQMPSHTHNIDSSGSTTSIEISNLKAKIPFTTDTGDSNVLSATKVFAAGDVKKGRNAVGDALIYKEGSSSDSTKEVDVSTSKADIDINVTAMNTGGTQSHSNMQPYLAVNYIIALQGIFPSRS